MNKFITLFIAVCIYVFTSIQTNASAKVVNQYQEAFYGGIRVIQVYDNGNKLVSTYTTCTLCYGTGRCNICNGQGGIISAGYGNYYPCNACGQSGRCQLCAQTGGYILSGSQLYDRNNNPIYVGGGGSASGNSGSKRSGSRSSSSRRSSADRYGYIDCHLCKGRGVCSSCGGNTRLYGSYRYELHSCPNCLGYITDKRTDWGLCKKCDGTGKVYGIK